jgi:hypothetical protein
MKQRNVPGNCLILKYVCVLFLVLSGGIGIIGSAGGGPGEIVTYGGYILLQDDSPLEGVEVTFFWPDPPNFESDGILTVFTDEDGRYSMELTTFSPPADFTITPSHPDYTFSPESYSFGSVSDDHLELDFVAIPKS